MKQDDDNLSFGNNIYHHNVSSSRIIFTNANELNVDSDTHFLREILINSKLNKINILLLAKTNTHWKKRRAHQYWKEKAVTISETKLSWDSIYKYREITIITDNKIRPRKIKSGEDSHGLERWSYLLLQERDGRMVILISVYKVYNGPIDPTETLTATTQEWTILNNESENTESIPSLTVIHLIIFHRRPC